jgi:intracellular sulfur oxidation DsrE/DsrF family protein
MKLINRHLRTGLAALLAVGVLSALPLAHDAMAAKAGARTVVYHIDDSARAIPMIRNITNHRRADADIRIVVVALGAGIDFLVEDAMDDRGNSYDALVDPLMAERVEFRVCNNTLNGRGISADNLLPDVKVVPSGVAEVARLQIEEDAAYLKP